MGPPGKAMQMYVPGVASETREFIDSFEFGLADLGRIRRVVMERAVAAGLPGSRAADLALAVNEIAGNAIVHGRPPARLSLRKEDGDLICEVTDAGDGIEDALAGRRRPSPEAPGGRGLWLSRLICDTVEISSGVGCTVSLRAATPS
jgi:anti-sigma regulatory factor (Ser/Thr protein kinase)